MLAAAGLAAVFVDRASAQAPGSAPPYVVISREGRRPLPARTFGGQEMFGLDDLARLFNLTIREETAAGGLSVSTPSQTIALTPGQPLASVGGRLISLPAAPVREGRAWFVPVDFVARAIGPALGTRLELRRPSRLIVLGDLRMPRVAGRIEPLGTLARLTIDVAPATAHTVTQDGPHLTIRFDADALDATLAPTTAPDLIQNVHAAEGAPALVVDLGPRVASFRTADVPGDRGTGRVVIDVIAQTSDASQPAAGAPGAPPSAQTPPVLDLPPAGGLRTIVVDAGHGGEEEGARGPAGTLEKNVTLGVARRLKSALEARLGVRVILTRDSDATVGLDERAAVANNNKADLFISLHANASVRPSMTGAEVFYLSLDEYGEEAQRVAHADSEALPVFGGGARDIEVILWEMAQARYIERSAALAQAAEAALREHVPMSPRAIQQAPFRVLVGANMPAILVEMGFISNPAQERELGTEGFQSAIVQALVDSIVRFRDSGAGTRTAAAGGDQKAPPPPPGAGGR